MYLVGTYPSGVLVGAVEGPTGPTRPSLVWKSAVSGHRTCARSQRGDRGWDRGGLRFCSAAHRYARRAYKRWARRRVLDWPRPAITAQGAHGRHVPCPAIVWCRVTLDKCCAALSPCSRPAQPVSASILHLAHGFVYSSAIPSLFPRPDSVGDKGTRSHSSHPPAWGVFDLTDYHFQCGQDVTKRGFVRNRRKQP